MKDLFVGTLILLSGDFRQIPPVIPRSIPADELNSCLEFNQFNQFYGVT